MADNTVILFPEEEGSQSLASSLDTKEQKAKEEDAKEEETLGKEAMEKLKDDYLMELREIPGVISVEEM